MIRFLNNLFNIRTEEWPHVLLLLLFAIFLNIADIWGTTVAYTAFLNQGGIGVLRWILILSAVFSILFIAIYTVFVDRVDHYNLLMALYVFSMVHIVLGVVLLWLKLDKIAYPLIYILFLARVSVSDPHFTTYVNNFYDTQAAKRVLPVVFSGFRAGAIIAGFTMPFLTSRFHPRTIIVIWLLMYVPIMGLARCIHTLQKKGSSQQKPFAELTRTGGQKKPPSYIENMREGFRYITQSIYLRWMTIAMLLLIVLISVIEYRSSGLLREEFLDQREFTNFLGLLTSLGNIIALPILLFGISRLIARLGLGNVNLIFPAGNLLVCIGLIFVPGRGSASLAYLARTAFMIAFRYPVDSLLYNAVPLRIKGRARAVVSGLIAPLGKLLGGLLLFVPAVVSITWLISMLIGGMAVAYMVSTLVIRRQYSRALINMLEREDYSFLLAREASELTIADQTTLNWLQKKLKDSTSHDLIVFMAQLISQVGGSKAIPILGQVARTAIDARTRAAIIDILVAADVHNDTVRQLYTDLLADPDGEVRQSAIAGLEQLADLTDKRFLSKMLEMLEDPGNNVCVQALLALAHSADFYQLAPAVRVLDQLLADESPERRVYGIQILGQIGDERAIKRLLDYLTDPAGQVRLEAAITVEKLSSSPMPNQITPLIVEKMNNLLQDPIERVRQAALTVLGYTAYASSQLLIAALKDSSAQIRATAADALVQKGKSIIPVIHSHLNSSDPQLRKMVAVILGRINHHEFGLLIRKHITENLLTVYRNYGYLEALALCTGYQSIPILQSILREQNQQLVHEIFYLLTAIHGSSDVKIITESLQSEDSRIRANAIEALESLTTPQTTRLIAPLFEPELPFPQLIALSKDIWDMEQPTMIQTFQQLVTEHDDPWIRRLTIFALGEISAVLISKIKQSFTNPVADPGSRANSSCDVNTETVQFPLDPQTLFTLPEMEALVDMCLTTGVTDEVQQVVNAARRLMTLGAPRAYPKEKIMLSTIEKMIFLKEVPFFKGMTVEQLKILANVCEEKLFEEDTRIFNAGDPGGILYVVVNGRVGIEQEKRAGSFVRVNTIEPRSSFGEITLFDGSPRTASAIAIRDTLILQLRREPLIALARQYPELSLELIKVLSNQLREAYDRTAALTRSRPRQLQKLFDQFD